MKVLMLNYEYPPLGGGQGNANKFIYDVFNKDYEITIDLITSSVDKPRIENYKIGTIHYLDIGKQNTDLSSQKISDLLVSTYKSIRLALQLTKKTNYDLVVIWSGIPTGIIGWILKMMRHLPYIILLRGADVPFYEARWKNLDRFIFQWLSPFLWKRAAKVIANSSMLKELAYQTSTKTPIEIITNGIDIKYFTPPASRDYSSKITILSVGRLIQRKGFDLLIEAVSGLENKNVEIWLAGDGPYKELLSNLAQSRGIAERVKFLGDKRKDDLVAIYQQASIFCLPSYNEGMSNAVLEAISCGLPVVLTKVGGSEELVNGNGKIVDTGNIEQLKAAIQELIADENHLKAMSLQSRAIAEQLSWENITRKFHTSFQQTIQ